MLVLSINLKYQQNRATKLESNLVSKSLLDILSQ